jgi:uncharacterized protein YkwD
MKTLKTLLLTAIVSLAICATASAGCGHAANVDPASPGASMRAARSATLCLLNQQRARHHEHRLRFNHRLAIAGLRHARDMVDNRYFAHTAPSGQNFIQRILNTNYVPPASNWLLGENLAWGDRTLATPRQIVRAWMKSPEHRHNILTRGFREIGIAIVVGAPVNGVAQAATYATEFGAVHRS